MLYSENIKNIRDLTTKDTSDYGSKAVKMGLLMRKGFFVPNGFCVSSGAFNRYFENMEGFRDTDSSFVVKKEDVKTPWILNYFNSRINAKQYLEQSRYGKKINFIMEPKGNLLLAGTIIQVSYPRFGWGSNDFLVQQYSLH